MYSLANDRPFVQGFKDTLIRHWHSLRHSQGLRVGHDANNAVCPLSALVPRLCHILEEVGHGPLDPYRNCLREMVRELQFIDENGDSVIDDQEMQIIEREVNVLLETLEAMRIEARRRGGLSHWGNCPTMFG